MTPAAAPRILIVAGPNGAGKTTFAREFLTAEADCPVFVNADLIAAGLSPFAPELAARKAARIMLEAMDEHIRLRKSFAFETTLSGRAYAQHISPMAGAGLSRQAVFFTAAACRAGDRARGPARAAGGT